MGWLGAEVEAGRGGTGRDGFGATDRNPQLIHRRGIGKGVLHAGLTNGMGCDVMPDPTQMTANAEVSEGK